MIFYKLQTLQQRREENNALDTAAMLYMFMMERGLEEEFIEFATEKEIEKLRRGRTKK